MKTRLTTILLLLVLCLPALAQQSQVQTAPSPAAVIEKVTPSVAMVLIGTSPTQVDGVGSAVVVRPGGVLLTAYHVVKDAKIVQVRFKNGEVFDDVQLLGVDARRDVAAIRINATSLPTLSLAKGSEAKAGEAVYVVSHPETLAWTASAGIVSAYRLADEVPGLGTGFRLVQFTAPASPGSSGGVLLTSKGELIGLVIGGIEQAQNLNFAIPIESVLGLADATVSRTFASGAGLTLPTNTPAATQTAAVPSAQAASGKPEKAAVDPIPTADDLNKSEILKSKDPEFILRNFRTMYVDAENAVYFKSHQMISALGSNPDFAALHVNIVDDRALADVVLEVGYTFAWDYPFQLKHQNTSMVLLAGKGAGAFSGPAGAGSVAKNLAKMLKPYRTPPAETKKPKQ